MLKTISKDAIPPRGEQKFSSDILARANAILEDIRINGNIAARQYAEKLDGLRSDAPLTLNRDDMSLAFNALSQDKRLVLERTAERVRSFAEAQKACLTSLSHAIPGGYAGHDILPVETAGCYAPNGNFPLPSSVLMTAIPARVAGVKNVIVASPRPTPETISAAFLAGADALIQIGGAQAIGALVYGTENTLKADVIVGPGGNWVTAAKQIVSGRAGIDMLAGPSELMIIADEMACPKTVAADLIAQAEHDKDALPVLITTSEVLIDAVNQCLVEQVEALPPENKEIAFAALSNNGYVVLVDSIDEAVDIANNFAPEHLEVLTVNARDLAPKLTECGGLFIGSSAAEVIGDYGAGPNHTLPTGGTARHKGGLSVFNFLRVRTWIDINHPEDAQQLYQDASALGYMEGLVGHARSAEKRLKR